MIHRIATILKDRIAAFTYVDKIGGLTRVARQQREGREIVIPVAGDVDEAYACDPATIRDMVPDERYGCMVYFEDRGTTRETSRTRGTFYSASIRLVCWVNTAKFGSDPNAADRILEQFTSDLNVGQPYNTDTLIGLKHQVDGIPQRGASIFSQYTYPEAARQYLLWPFDAFALDITATYRIKPGCEEAPTPENDACWTPPTTKKRRNPSEFTCEELTDPITGLTAAQLGPECLDCEGGGPCEDGAVNWYEEQLVSVPSGGSENLTCDTQVNAAYVQDGGSVTGTYTLDGTLNGRNIYRLDVDHNLEYTGTRWRLVKPGADVDAAVGTEQFPWQADWSATTLTVTQATIGEYCGGNVAPCDPLTVTVGRATLTEVTDPCGKTVAMSVIDKNGTNVDNIELDGLDIRILDLPAPPCEDAAWTLRDSAANTLNTGTIPSGGSANIDAPDGSVQRRDSAGNAIGSPIAVRSGQTGLAVTCPDGTVTIQNSVPTTLHAVSVRSNGTATQAIADSTITRPDGTTIGLPATTPLDVRDYRSGIVYALGRMLHSGQTTSYRSSDEGSMLADGFFDYTRPAYPLRYAQLTNFSTLAENNMYGNTLRFTARDSGAAAPTSGDRWIRDHYIGVDYYVLGSLLSGSWNTAIDSGVTLRTTLGEGGIYHVNDRILDLLTDNALASPLNYAPLNIVVGTNIWTSTTRPDITANAFFLTSTGAFGNGVAKSTSQAYGIYVKRFA